jgi:hypothetical protein
LTLCQLGVDNELVTIPCPYFNSKCVHLLLGLKIVQQYTARR